MRYLQTIVTGLGFASVFSSITKASSSSESKPNIIIIMTDDQGYGELSIHGNPILKTPNLDKLHSESVRFTDFHSAPMCTPTRGQLLTGIDAVGNGAVNVSSGRSLLDPNIKTMADIFVENGYNTGLFGKWHLGDNYPFRPENRGFKHTVWFPASHIGSVPDYWENDYFDDVYVRNGVREKFKGFCTDVFFSEAMQFIKESANKPYPFLCYIPLNAPHAPFHAPKAEIQQMEMIVEKSFVDMPENKKHNFIRYLAMIRNIDQNVGKLDDFLKKENLYENTILIFLTDNGSTFGPDYYNAGMRGRKTTPYEGGHRVPFFFRWPANKQIVPKDIQGLTQVQDVLPSLMDFCNIGYSQSEFDGNSLADIISDKKPVPTERTLFINYSRMPLYFDYPSPFSNSIIRKNETVVLYKNWRLINDYELYNLKSDFAQENNVIDSFPMIASLLREKRDNWWNSKNHNPNRVIKIPIGLAEQDNPIELTSCEWMDVLVDMQTQIVKGERKNSYWLLDVTKNGKYRFTLKRWPEESNLTFKDNVCNGINTTISSARIFITQKDVIFSAQKHVNQSENKVSFTYDLQKGEIAVHTWFMDKNNQSLSGAYYLEIEKLNLN